MVKAADWLKVTDDNDVTVYMDKESITIKGKVIDYWEKWNYKKTQTKNGKPYISVLAYRHIDCKEKTYGFRSVTWYDNDGNIVESQDFTSILMVPIRPDSGIDVLSKKACNTLNQSKHQ
mgnify:CR=1 FL=1